MNRELQNDTINLAEATSDSLRLLKDLYTEQNRLGNTGFEDFDITEYLQAIDAASYEDILKSEEGLCIYAAQLFEIDIIQIQFEKKRVVTSHCSEIIFNIQGEYQSFYIKNAWEGAIKEGLGLELNNLLTDTPIRYLCNSEIIITEKVFDALTPDQVYVIRDTPNYIFAFGAWEIFTTILHLTDRKNGNMRWNGQRLANIDFGLAFYRGKLVFDSRFTITETSKTRKQGQVHALTWVLNKIEQPKVQHLLLNIDATFCHNLTCHRHPVPPLRSIINILEGNVIKELYTEMNEI